MRTGKRWTVASYYNGGGLQEHTDVEKMRSVVLDLGPYLSEKYGGTK